MFYLLSKPLIYVLKFFLKIVQCHLVFVLVCQYKLCGSYVYNKIFVIVVVLLHVVFIFTKFSNKELFTYECDFCILPPHNSIDI